MSTRNFRRLMLPLTGAVLSAWLPLAFGACATSQTSDGGGPIPIAQYCSRTADDVCAQAGKCCGAPFDQGACITAVKATCEARVKEQQRLGRVYDGTAQSICRSSFLRTFDGCNAKPVSDPAFSTYVNSCLRVWRGTAPLGARCASEVDCADQPGEGKVVCAADGAASGSIGRNCELRPYVGEGKRCNVAAPDGGKPGYCTEGTFCEPGSYVCRSTKPEGSACSTATECHSNYCGKEGLCAIAEPTPYDIRVCTAFGSGDADVNADSTDPAETLLPDSRPPAETGSSCEVCSQKYCSYYSKECGLDFACVNQRTCVNACTDSACIANCKNTYPSAKANSMYACLVNYCKIVCS
ncbi:MAG: hypothetical protein NVS3B20_21780 [Polyangiales bacterium]